MTITSISPVLRALVAYLRAQPAIRAGLTGIHEGLAPDATAYPFGTYQVANTRYSYDMTGVTLRGSVSFQVISADQVEARNLDALVMAALHDAALSVSGQSTLYCRRYTDLSSVDVDDQGKKVYMVGGMYDIWTTQGLP